MTDHALAEPLLDAVRRQLAPVWPWFRLRWGGFARDAEMERSDPDACRGILRVFDASYVAGVRHPGFFAVSPDYVALLRWFWRRDHPDIGDADIAGILSSIEGAGHRAGWPFLSMTGQTFQWQIRAFEANGHDVGRYLARTQLGPDELAYLANLADRAGLHADDMAAILCDFGGAVFSGAHLDAAGLARVEVAIEAKMAGLWRPGVERP